MRASRIGHSPALSSIRTVTPPQPPMHNDHQARARPLSLSDLRNARGPRHTAPSLLPNIVAIALIYGHNKGQPAPRLAPGGVCLTRCAPMLVLSTFPIAACQGWIHTLEVCGLQPASMQLTPAGMPGKACLTCIELTPSLSMAQHCWAHAAAGPRVGLPACLGRQQAPRKGGAPAWAANRKPSTSPRL